MTARDGSYAPGWGPTYAGTRIQRRAGTAASDGNPPVITYVGSTTITSTATITVTTTDDTGILASEQIQATLPSGAIEIVYDNTAFRAPYAAGTKTAVAGGWSFTFTRSPAWPGNVSISTQAVDRAGNASQAGQAFTVTGADTTPPVVSNRSPVAGSVIATGASLAFDVTDAGVGLLDATINASLGGTVEPVYASGAFVAPYASSTTGVIGGGLHFSVTRTGGWTLGAVTLSILARDLLKNESLSAYGVSVADTTPPTFGGATSIDTPTLDSLKVHWTAGTDAVTPQGSLVYDVAIGLSAGACTGANFAGARVVSSTPGATSVVVGGLSQGTTYYACVRCRDAAGNEDSNNATVSATTSIPTPPDVTPPTVVVSPTPGTTVGPYDILGVTVTDLGGLRAVLVVAFFGSSSTPECVWDGGAFRGIYAAGSMSTAIANGISLGITRAGGWPSAPSLQVFAFDLAGNEGG